MDNTKTIGLVVAALLIIGGGAYWWSQQSALPQATWVNADESMLTLDLIKPGAVVLPQFKVTGHAVGPWFFEASFPVEVLDASGNSLVTVPAQAEGEWMTEELVPFSATVEVGGYRGPATLVLHKDNPSGEAVNDASISIPIEVFDVNQ